MATDATGTPTSPDNIPTYNTAVDAPSGKGFNAAMAAIQTALNARVSAPSGIATGEVPVWNGTTWARSTTTHISASSLAASPAITTFLRGDSSWAKGGLNLLWDSSDAGVTLPAASVTTPSLDQSFKHLVIVGSCRSSATLLDTLNVRTNGLSTASYYWQDINGNGTTLSGASSAGTAGTSGAIAITEGDQASLPSARGSWFTVIPDYTNSNLYKHWIGMSMAVYGGASGNTPIYLVGGMSVAMSTALTSLTFFYATNNIMAGSRISVYGI